MSQVTPYVSSSPGLRYLSFRKYYEIRLCIRLYIFKTYVKVTNSTNRYLVTWTIELRQNQLLYTTVQYRFTFNTACRGAREASTTHTTEAELPLALPLQWLWWFLVIMISFDNLHIYESFLQMYLLTVMHFKSFLLPFYDRRRGTCLSTIRHL